MTTTEVDHDDDRDDAVTMAVKAALDAKMRGEPVALASVAHEYKVDERTLAARYDAVIEADLLLVDGPSDEVITPGATTLGDRFRVDEVIGQGGMGTVYGVHDTRIDRGVAIKVVRDVPGVPMASVAERFEREARIAGSLEHPNIAPIYHVGRTPAGRPYLVMKRVDGMALGDFATTTLQSDIDERRAWREITGVFIAVTNAVEFAHSRGVIHRDLKPNNLLVGPFREALVLDWGLAKADTESEVATLGAELESGDPTVSLSGFLLGTPAYLAPEQATVSRGRPSPLTDVFGIGAMLFHVLSGEGPFHAASHAASMERARTGDVNYDAIERADHKAPHELVGIARTALQRQPDDRYASVAAMREDLEAFLDNRKGRGWRDPLHQRATKFIARRPAAALALATVPAFAWMGQMAVNGIEVVRADERRAEVASWNSAFDEVEAIREQAEDKERQWLPILERYLGVFKSRGADLESYDGQQLAREIRDGRLSSPAARRATAAGMSRILHGLMQSDWAYTSLLLERKRVSTLMPDSMAATPDSLIASSERQLGEATDGERWIGLWRNLSAAMLASPDLEYEATFSLWHEAIQGDEEELRELPFQVIDAGASDRVALWAAEMSSIAFLRHPDEAVKVWRTLAEAHRGSFAVHDAYGFHMLKRRLAVRERTPLLLEARDALLRATAIRPSQRRTWNRLSLVYQELGALEDAIRTGRIALELKPDHGISHGNLSLTLRKAAESAPADERANLLAEATVHADEFVRLNPEKPNTHLRRAEISISEGSLDDALRVLEAAAKLHPRHDAITITLMQALAAQPDGPQRVLERAIRFYEPDPTWYAPLVFACGGAGDMHMLGLAEAIAKRGAKLATDARMSPFAEQFERQLEEYSRTWALTSGVRDPSSAWDAHRKAVFTLRSDQTNDAANDFESLVAMKNGISDDNWRKVTGYHAWSTYRYAAIANARVAAGDGFADDRKLIVVPSKPWIDALNLEQSTAIVAAERTSLRESDLWTDSARSSAQQRAIDLTSRACEALLASHRRGDPDAEKLSRWKSRFLDDPWITPIVRDLACDDTGESMFEVLERLQVAD